jgi:hypothetical protein
VSWQKRLRNELAALPTELESFMEGARAILSQCQVEFAHEVQRRLSETVAGMPPRTIDGKRRICSLVNATAARFGLAVKCPHTGLPGRLYAHFTHDPDRDSWFRFELMDPSGRRIKSPTFRECPPIVLVPHGPIGTRQELRANREYGASR